MKIMALICYGWLAAQSGVLLWILWQIKRHGKVTIVEPNTTVLVAELAMTGLILLAALAMFVRERVLIGSRARNQDNE
jgi:DMSO/TMAO reductase YedYZ heme-binding membrane subunit